MKKQILALRRFSRTLIVTGLVVSASNVFAQQAVIVDPQLGKITLVNDAGFAVSADALTGNQLVSLKIPVLNDNHGKGLPAGSCKIKIGLGSKLIIDPAYNINNSALSNYFKWSFAEVGGQVQITGDLINPLPASVKDVTVTFKVKANKEGRSTITANFLITNHNTTTVLSDENGNNNTASLAYRISGKPVATGEAAKLGVYPNPVKDVKTVTIDAGEGLFNGKYQVQLFDVNGKLVQSSAMELNQVSRFNYQIGQIAAGNYMIQITKQDATVKYTLKLEKL